MKVKELIVALGAFDPELKVVVDGYEGGYDDPEELEIVSMKNTSGSASAWYYGKYDYVGIGEKSEETAVSIPR